MTGRCQPHQILLTVVAAGSAVVFAADIVVVSGIAVPVLYIPIILTSLLLWDAKLTIFTAVGVTMLTMVGYFLSPTGDVAESVAVKNLAMSLVAIWSATLISFLALVQHRKVSIEQEVNEDLTRSNTDLEQFASIASHDLQSPIRKVRAFSDRLLDLKPELSEQQADYVRSIQKSAQRMQLLVKDLLDYSRVATGSQSSEQVDLNQCVDEVRKDLEESVRKHGVKIKAGPLPVIHADPTQIRQLLQNLIDNAVKYRKASVAPEIRISARDVPPTEESPGDFVELRVQDNGIGFNQIYSARVFELFKRLHGPDEYEGTGIGLAICKRIVEKHGGTIRVKSVEGTGTEFIITLPRGETLVLETEGEAA